MKLVRGLCGVVLLGVLAGCGKGSLRVTVVDASLKGLAGANVTLSPQGKSGITDFFGQANLDELDKGPAVVFADSPGYSTKAQSVTVENNTNLTIMLFPATRSKVYQGNAVGNPYTVSVPEATLSGKVVVQVYGLWTTGEWLELPETQVIAGIVYEHRATVGEGFVKLATYRTDYATLYSGDALLGATYKIVVTGAFAGAPRVDSAWHGSTGR